MAEINTEFDIKPRAVTRWLDNLPIAHIGETARQLYTALRDVNRQDNLRVRHYFRFLESVSEPLNMILPELHKHYVGKAQPLSKKRRKIADLYTQLLHQPILGYEQVISQAIELNRFGWQKVVTTCVHRIFHYSGLMLLNQRLLHQPFQKGLWQQIYWLYQMADGYKLLNAKLRRLDSPGCKSSIADEFKKLLLSAILAPNLFRPDELEEVLDNMPVWIDLVSVTSQRSNQGDQIYAFTLDTDIAPGLMANNINISENPAIQVRYLNISALLQFLTRLLTQARPGEDTINLDRQHRISRRTLLLLLNNWGRPTSRDGERRLIQGQAEIAIGVSAIHYVISEGRHSPQPDNRGSDTNGNGMAPATSGENRDNSQSLAAMGFTTDRDMMVDVWESVYFEPEPTAPSWTDSIRMKVYSYLNAKVLNISKGGFCIGLPRDGVEHIQTGELVAIRGKRGEWQLGEIRWLLCPRNAAIRAGIQRHSNAIRPADLHVASKHKQSQPIKCLLGENENGQLLFLPNLPFSLADKKLTLEVKGVLRQFNLQDQLYATPAGSGYYFEWRKKPEGNEPGDGYESIWAKL